MNIFLAGGTGKTGRRVASRLVDRGHDARVGSRTAVVPFDWHRPETWPDALGTTVDAVYLAYAPDLAVPGAAAHVAELAGLARARGAGRTVLLSGRGEPGAKVAEDAVRTVAPELTVLRSAWMNQNLSEGDLRPLVLAGEVALPVGDVGEPFVDADDVADVAVAALVDEGHEGRTYDVTGPRLLTVASLVGEIATATRRPLRHRRIEPEEFAAALAADGVPAESVELITGLFVALTAVGDVPLTRRWPRSARMRTRR